LFENNEKDKICFSNLFVLFVLVKALIYLFVVKALISQILLNFPKQRTVFL